MGEAKVDADPVADVNEALSGQAFATARAASPWRFINRIGKVAPERRRLSRCNTMGMDDIRRLPVAAHAQATAHLYRWVPNTQIENCSPGPYLELFAREMRAGWTN